MEQRSTETIVNAFFAALARRDFPAARKLLADDFRFEGPFDIFSAPEPYLVALQKLYPIVKGVQVRKMFVDGGHVCMLYDMETNTAAGTQLICEWFQVEANKIVSTRAVFDARPFAALFSH
jgi:limonene-1,2-epoxide hydrolase